MPLALVKDEKSTADLKRSGAHLNRSGPEVLLSQRGISYPARHAMPGNEKGTADVPRTLNVSRLRVELAIPPGIFGRSLDLNGNGEVDAGDFETADAFLLISQLGQSVLP